MTKTLLIAFAFLFQPLSNAALALNPGDVMFVGLDADVDDGFAIVALVSIPNATTINFFDKDGAGQINWTTTSIVTAGTVVIFESVHNSSASVNIGSINRTSGFEVTGDDEALVAKDGGTCLSAIRNDINTSLPASCSGLSTNYIVSSSLLDEDVMVYSGSTICNTTLADCQAMIVNTANWSTQDGSGDQSIDNTFPDYPDDLPSSFSGLALPVEISFFTGRVSTSIVELNWQTKSEQNNELFEVEKRNNNSNFKYLGTVHGQGTSYNEKNYHFSDPTPSPGPNHYRLKQVDFDGSFTYSKVVSVFFGEVGATRLYPTATTGELNLELGRATENGGTILLYDHAGRYLQNWETGPEELHKTLDVSGLQPGGYLLKIQTGHTVEVLRFVKI